MTSGDSLDRYQILGPLGSGGMAEVFLALDTALNRKVALKFPSESIASEPLARQRFMREAKAAAGLDHPFVCKVYEAGEDRGRLFIAMEYVEGETLADRLVRGPLPLEEAIRTSLEIAEALQVAHQHGIVHRDLKPSNVMLTQGHAKVMDFGLAKRVAPDISAVESDALTFSHGGRTDARAVIGTPAYMSPEQARGEPVDARSDIFAFGIVLFEMVTGKHPFRKTSPLETVSAILKDAPPPLKADFGVPSRLKSIIRKCLHKSPAERYESTQTLVADLEQLRPVTGRLAPGLYSWAIGSLVAIVLLAGAWWFGLGKSSPLPLDEPKATVSILIADFENRTGDTVFDGALEQAMSIGLEGAAFVTSYGRPQARRLAAQLDPEASGRLDERLVQLVCRSVGIKVAVTGSIEPRGDGYSLTARAFDPVTTETVSEANVDVASKAEVLRAADLLAGALREDLGDTTIKSAEVFEHETFTTASLEAMNRYASAQELLGLGKYAEAETEYQKALAADSQFGRAFSGLAVLNYNRGELEQAEKNFSDSLAHMGRMSERERHRTRGSYFVNRGNYAMAVEDLMTLVEQYPADFVGHNNLALAHFYLRNMAQALEHTRRGLAIYPENVILRNNLALYAMYAGDFDTATKEATIVLERNPSFRKAHLALALTHLAGGQVEEARERYRELASIGDREASSAEAGLADLELYEGRLDEVVTRLEGAVEFDLEKGFEDPAARKLVMLAEAHLESSEPAAAIASMEQALSHNQGVAVVYPASRLFLETGHRERARAFAHELASRAQSEHRAYGKLIEGEAALAGGDPQGAVRILLESKDLADSWLTRFAMGRAYLEAGAFAEAHAQLELCLKRRGEATSAFLDEEPSYHYLPSVYYYLGRAQEGLRDSAARDSYGTFLSTKESGQETELVADARRRVASKN